MPSEDQPDKISAQQQLARPLNLQWELGMELEVGGQNSRARLSDDRSGRGFIGNRTHVDPVTRFAARPSSPASPEPVLHAARRMKLGAGLDQLVPLMHVADVAGPSEQERDGSARWRATSQVPHNGPGDQIACQRLPRADVAGLFDIARQPVAQSGARITDAPLNRYRSGDIEGNGRGRPRAVCDLSGSLKRSNPPKTRRFGSTPPRGSHRKIPKPTSRPRRPPMNRLAARPGEH